MPAIALCVDDDTHDGHPISLRWKPVGYDEPALSHTDRAYSQRSRRHYLGNCRLSISHTALSAVLTQSV